MSMQTVRALTAFRNMQAMQKKQAKEEAAGIDVTAEDYGTPRNRAEKRQRVRQLPRSFRTSIHGRGQWRKKVVTENGLERV